MKAKVKVVWPVPVDLLIHKAYVDGCVDGVAAGYADGWERGFDAGVEDERDNNAG
jgi:hypothetical protein